MPRPPMPTSPSEARPTLADMERYAQGRMNQADAADFESLLADDPLLADALEGLMAMPDRQVLRKRLAYLRRQSQQRVLLRSRKATQREKLTRRVRPMWWPQALVGFAAALALLLLIGILLPHRQPATLAEAEATETDHVIKVTPSLAPLPMVVAPADSQLAEATAPSPPKPTVTGPAPDRAASPATSPLPPPEEKAEADDAGLSAGRLAQTQDHAYPDAEPLAVAPASRQRQQEVRATTELASKAQEEKERARTGAATARKQVAADEPPLLASALAQGRQAHAAQQWEAAQRAAMQALALQAGDPEALFLVGDSYYRQGKARQAIPYLIQVGPQAAPWYERARWSLALAYDATQQRAQARAVLDALQQRPGLYQRAARYLLDFWSQP